MSTLPRAGVTRGVGGDQLRLGVPAAELQRVRQAYALYGKQAEFALSLAMNDVARQGREAVRAALPQHLEVRTAQSQRYLERLISARTGTRARPQTAVEIMRGTDYSRRSVLPSLGVGETRTAGASGPLPIPTVSLGRPGASVIPRAYSPRSLGVLERRDASGAMVFGGTARRTRGKARVRKGQQLGPVRTKAGKWMIWGKDRTFAIDPRYHPGQPARRYGVYRRFGPASTEIEMLYHYQLTNPIPKKLPVEALVAGAAARGFGPAFDRALARALATAR